MNTKLWSAEDTDWLLANCHRVTGTRRNPVYIWQLTSNTSLSIDNDGITMIQEIIESRRRTTVETVRICDCRSRRDVVNLLIGLKIRSE